MCCSKYSKSSVDNPQSTWHFFFFFDIKAKVLKQHQVTQRRIGLWFNAMKKREIKILWKQDGGF